MPFLPLARKAKRLYQKGNLPEEIQPYCVFEIEELYEYGPLTGGEKGRSAGGLGAGRRAPGASELMEAQVKALFINGSPRKTFNTAQMLQSAMTGAADAGAETEWINLYDYEFTGCRSCFACKIKNSKTNGVCAIRDSIRPVLKKAKNADVIVFGSPVYYGYPTGQLRNFVERLLFPLDTYMVDKRGERVKFDHKPIQTGLIYTMNCPEWLMKKVEYPTLLGFTGAEIGRLCGYNEVLYSCDTYQFSDYSRYDCNMFPGEKKREHRTKQFPIDLEKAYELGKGLAERAKA